MTKLTCSSHVFVLPPPNGQESLGVCKHCGLKKRHYNSDPVESGHWKHTSKATAYQIKNRLY